MIDEERINRYLYSIGQFTSNDCLYERAKSWFNDSFPNHTQDEYDSFIKQLLAVVEV